MPRASPGSPGNFQTSGASTTTDITLVGGAAISLGQKTMATSFPVVIASDQSAITVSVSGTVTVTGTVAATQSGTWNIATLTTITNVVHVDDNLSSITVDGTLAVTQSGTWDEVGINDSGNSITVDGTITANLAAGTNNIGDVDVLTIAAGDNNIGNVDIVTVPSDPFGANADAASATGSISAKLRFIAATGIPITGTVAVTQSGTWDEVGINDSGNVITVDGSGSAGTAASGVVTIQGIASMTPVQIADNSGSITVDYATTGSGTATGALRVELPTNGTGVVGLNAGTNAIGKLAANSGVDIGDVDVTSIAAGTNKIGDVDIAPRTTGGWSVGNFTSGDTYTALTSTAQVIKGSAGKFGGYYIYNPNTAATYVLVYNIAAASVTVGTSTATLVFCIPASSGANLELLAGIPFGTAMSIAATTTGGGNTAPATALEAMIFYV